MNTSFTGVSVTPTVAASLPATDTNSLSIQSDSDVSGGFNEVFEQFSTAASPVVASDSPDGQALLAALQNLPQGGKLLPLVQQTLDKVAAGGGDLKQLLARLTSGLKQLAREQDSLPAGQTPAEQLALVLQPLVQEQPGLQGMLPTEISAALQRQTLQGEAGAEERLSRTLAAAVSPQKAADGAANPPSSGDATTARDSKPPGLDLSAFAQLQQQQSADGGAREAETDLTALMSAIKRLTPDTARPVSADTAAAVTPASATAHAATPAGAQSTAVPTVSVNTPLGQADWDQALGERIQWLASQKVQGAQVKLNPANLGPMEVRIQVHNDQASVQFSAHHAAVREALEAALPRLRDMFEASGVQLVNVDVSSGSFSGQQQATQDMAGTPNWGSGAAEDADVTAESAPQTTLASFMASGRLDLFA